MGLAEVTLSAWLGMRPPGRISVGLVGAGRELGGAVGYQRVEGPWVMDGSEAAIRAKFGPFTAPVRFDALRVFDGDQFVSDFPIGVFQLPAGASHEQFFSISIAEIS